MRAGFYSSKVLLCVLLTLLGLIVLSGPASAVTQYTFTDLGGTCAYGVNSSGDAAGWAGNPRQAVLWEQGVMLQLDNPDGPSSEALGINALGQVVGSAINRSRACLWENGVIHYLDNQGYSSASDINDSGWVVGCAAPGYQAFLIMPEITPEGVVWYRDDNGDGRNDLMSFLILGGYESGGTAMGINASGLVVGGARNASDVYRAFLWKEDGMLDLGTLPGGGWSYAYGVSASGQVVGAAGTASGDTHAFLWEDGVMQDLGTFGGSYSWAYGINASGQVVGEADTASGERHAFLWESGTMYDLNDLVLDGPPGRILQGACDVNDLGQIVGGGSAFLLTPIPEPSVVGVVGLALLVPMRRLRPR